MNARKNFITILAGLALITGLGLEAQAQGRSEEALAALKTHAHMPGELLVQFRTGTSEQAKNNALGRFGAKRAELLVEKEWRRDGKGDLELVKLSPGIGIAAAVRGLELDANVEFAEPNWIYHHTAISNDTYFTNGSLWGMYGNATSPANLYGSQAGEAWAAGKNNCGSVYVGIIDEGYMYTHEDLAANAGKNPGESGDGKETNGLDDDGNGLVDDVYGWDFDGNDNTIFDGVGDDHGTHVAGTIGGVGGNGKGVAGVCWSVKLLSAKFLGRNGGTTANAILAVDYLTDLKTRHGLNIVATNNSWGGGGFSQSLEEAIERANVANILFIAAAGNGGSDGVGDNNDATASYPASYNNANVIAVAAIDSAGNLAGFSNYGATSVDIGAPGVGIWSTVPKSAKRTISSGYASYNGTSMATPHVTGAAALYAANNSGISAADIKAAILGSSAVTASLDGKVTSNGRLDVGCLVVVDCANSGGTNPPPTGSDTTPPVITNVVSATSGKGGTFVITWTTDEPSTSAVTFEGGGTYTDSTLVTSHSMSFRGTKGATYTYSVTSVDATGNSATSLPYSHNN